MQRHRVQDLGEGVFLIDTFYKRADLAACYLVRDGDEAALVDAGTARSLPTILALLTPPLSTVGLLSILIGLLVVSILLVLRGYRRHLP